MDTKHPNNDEVEDIDNLDLDRELEKISDHETSENETPEIDPHANAE